MSKSWQNFFFCVNYPLKMLLLIRPEKLILTYIFINSYKVLLTEWQHLSNQLATSQNTLARTLQGLHPLNLKQRCNCKSIEKCVFVCSASGSESESSPEKRVRVGEASCSEDSPRVPKQKNRRRCHRCQTKLELVQQELGSCRCG